MQQFRKCNTLKMHFRRSDYLENTKFEKHIQFCDRKCDDNLENTTNQKTSLKSLISFQKQLKHFDAIKMQRNKIKYFRNHN